MTVNIALLTVTDTRTLDSDKSGAILVEKIRKLSKLFFIRYFNRNWKNTSNKGSFKQQEASYYWR